MNVVDNLLAQLVTLGVDDVTHMTGDLGKHLRGTFERLQTWDSPEELCVAGLFHAVYGTYGSVDALVGLEKRPDVTAIIGRRAEEIVYVYAACDRPYFYPRVARDEHPQYLDRFTSDVFALTGEGLGSFCELTLANELDVFASNGDAYLEQYGRYYVPLFASDRFRRRLSESANAECELLLRSVRDAR
jgi:hypothetical protein